MCLIICVVTLILLFFFCGVKNLELDVTINIIQESEA